MLPIGAVYPIVTVKRGSVALHAYIYVKYSLLCWSIKGSVMFFQNHRAPGGCGFDPHSLHNKNITPFSLKTEKFEEKIDVHLSRSVSSAVASVEVGNVTDWGCVSNRDREIRLVGSCICRSR